MVLRPNAHRPDPLHNTLVAVSASPAYRNRTKQRSTTSPAPAPATPASVAPAMATTPPAAPAVADTPASHQTFEEQAAAIISRRRRLDEAAAGPVVAVRERVLDDPKRGYRHLGDFAADVAAIGEGRANIIKNSRLVLAAAGDGLSVGVRMDGGVLVPPGLAAEVWDGTRGQSDSLLQYCDVLPINEGVESVTFPASGETSRATGSRWGGVRCYWGNELAYRTPSAPKLRDVTLRPNELFTFVYVSDVLLRRSPQALGQFLADATADEMSFTIGNAIFHGDGVGKPLGIVGHPATVSATQETGQPAATIVEANVTGMYARLLPRWRAGAVWFVSPDAEAQIQKLSQTTYARPGSVPGVSHATLLGLPVIVCEYASTLGTVGDIVLANLNAYAVGMRGMVDSAVSMHLKFDYAQQAFRWIFEMDGQPWLASAITPFKGSATQSPIVTLATRA